MKNTRTFKVKIGPIFVSKPSGDWRGYYSFDFWLYEDGKLKEWGNYDSTYTVSAEAIRKSLKRGYAHVLVLQRYY